MGLVRVQEQLLCSKQNSCFQ
ncbi:hypothetical protein AYI69_g8868, partial [Smittium culicis]